VTPWVWVTSGKEHSAMPDAPLPAGCMAFVNGGTEDSLWGLVRLAGNGADWRAAAEFVAMARATAAAAPDSGSVAVIGDGLLAYLLKRMLPVAAAEAQAEARIVIDTTGLPASIKKAVARLPRRGHLVLAAPPRDTEVDLATYRDLHVRGLTLAGVGWVSAPAAVSKDDAAIAEALQLLVRIPLGQPTADGGVWYAVSGRDTV
jgi:hypothetical protein